MSEETNTEQLHPEVSPAEYRKLRLAAQNELKEEIKFLKTEEEYQRLMADIEDHKARRLRAIVMQYQLQNPTNGAMPQTKAEAKVYDHDEPEQKPFGPFEEEPPVPSAEAPVKPIRTLKTD
jgi:hypothetical protein